MKATSLTTDASWCAAVRTFDGLDGGLPQTFDPAFAAAPPDTDLVRAIFEGLTDYDPQTLAPVPAVATRWESPDEGRTWTFHLRDDARWSNGEAVTAKDFVEFVAPHREDWRSGPAHKPSEQYRGRPDRSQFCTAGHQS